MYIFVKNNVFIFLMLLKQNIFLKIFISWSSFTHGFQHSITFKSEFNFKYKFYKCYFKDFFKISHNLWTFYKIQKVVLHFKCMFIYFITVPSVTRYIDVIVFVYNCFLNISGKKYYFSISDLSDLFHNLK